MKKALVLLLALTLVGSFMFAEDEVVPRSTSNPTIAGSGKVTWGVGLNDGQGTGFKNESELEIKIPLIDQGSSTHGGDPITGEITLKDLSCAIDGDTAGWIDIGGGVEAKIKFPNNLYMTVYDAPGLDFNNAKSIAPYVDDGDWNDSDIRGLVKPAVAFVRTKGGTAIGMTGDFSFALKVASDGDWTNNVDHEYALGLDLGYVVTDMATINAGVIYGTTNENTSEFGYTLKATINPKDSGLTAVVALDGESGLMTGGVNGMDAMLTVDYSLAKMVSLGAAAYFGDADLATAGSRLDARVRVGLLAVENLVAEIAVDAWELLADPAIDPLSLFIGGKVNYTIKQGDVNYVKPYAAFGYALNDANLKMNLGVEAKLFPRTVLVLDYVAGSNPNDSEGTASATPGSDLDVYRAGANAFEDDLGVITISAKVTY